VPAIEVVDLRKQYAGGVGPIVAVDGVSFQVDEGEVYALLGHNGAGKSTTVEILEGHRERTGGAATVLGQDPATGGRELRDRIGIVLQTSGVEPLLTVREALELYASAYRRPRSATDLLDLAGLVDKADARIGTLSGGQRRRLDLALGIIGTPDVIFLDEPTTGFDPVARRQAWHLVEQLCEGGMTVLLTTHDLAEAERLADRVGVLARGRLVAEGTPEQLAASITGTVVTFEVPDGVEAGELARVLPPDTAVRGRRVEIATTQPTRLLAALTGWAVDRGVELVDLQVARPTLEDVFLRLAVEADPPSAQDHL
jgi:ABC-2 type transport system ATP-binding protein